MLSLRCYFILLLLVLYHSSSYTQPLSSGSLRFEQLTAKDGLISSPVRNIYQDKTGYIWFCTHDGLQRFDGKFFKTFYTNPNDTNSLSSDATTDIKQDKWGRYWILMGDNGGLCIYDPSNETYRRFNATTSKNFNENGDNLFNIQFTPDSNTALISGYNGFYKFDVSSLNYKRFTTDNSGLLHNWTEQILAVSNTLFLIITHVGFQVFDAGKDIFYRDKDTPLFKKLFLFTTGNEPVTIAKGKGGKYWFSTWAEHVYCYDSLHNVVTKIELDASFKQRNMNKLIMSLAKDDRENFYLRTADADVYYFNTENNKIEAHYNNDTSRISSYLAYSTGSLFYDRQKNLWAGSNTGVNKFHRSNNQFVYPHLQNGKKLMPTALLQSKNGHIWVGTNSGEGLIQLDKNFKKLRQYTRFEGVDQFSKNSIDHLSQTTNGNILISRNGFSILNPVTGEKDDFIDIPNLSRTAISSSVEDDDKQLWLASWRSKLIRLDPVQRKITSFPTAGVTYIYARDKNKLLLLIYDKGYKLFTFDMATEKFYAEPYHFFKQQDSLFIRKCGAALNVKFYGDKIYVITRRGLHILNKTYGAAQHYSRSDGLPSNRIHSIQKDNKGNIWLGTQGGLSLFNPHTKTFRNYGADDGLDDLDFQIGGLIKLDDNSMVASTSSTLVRFFPDSILFSPTPPAPVITALQVGNKELPFTAASRHFVSHRLNNIRIDFAALDFINSKSIRYAYKLEGFDKDWIQAGNTTTATYNNLDGGNYTFRVKAANATGEWNKTATYINFYVSKPFYKQAWFIVLIIVSITATMYAFYRSRIRRILEVQRLRNSISRDLHDEVGSTLSSISMLGTSAQYLLKNKQTEQAEIMVERINSSSQRILQVMDDLIWAINPQKDSVESMMERIRDFINDISDANGTKINLHTDPLMNKLNLPMKTKRNFYLIFKEALANVANHAACTQIDIMVKKEYNTILLQIRDDGKGFDIGKRHNGNGLKNMRQRAAEIGGSLHVVSERDTGTMLTLTMPIP